MIDCYGCLKNDNIIEDIIIATYPRCGSNFLQNSINNSTGYLISKTHDEIYDKRVISIIRDPLQSIASSVSMHGVYKQTIKSNGTIFINVPYNGIDVDNFIIKDIYFYKTFYEYLNSLNSKAIILKYEDLINNIDSVVNFLCKDFKILKNNKVDKDAIYNHIYNHVEKTGITPGYSLSSKKNENYNEIYRNILENYVNSINFKEVQDLYNLVLKKCINI
jgi:hypothetical protein